MLSLSQFKQEIATRIAMAKRLPNTSKRKKAIWAFRNAEKLFHLGVIYADHAKRDRKKKDRIKKETKTKSQAPKSQPTMSTRDFFEFG